MTTAVLLLLMFGAPARAHSLPRPPACLPDGIKSKDVVSAEPRGTRRAPKQVTVEQKLKQLKARCRRGKLVDKRGREIRFYRLQGCWGNPPQDYQEILARQQSEIDDLKKRYVVIEMTCNPSGVPVQ